MKVQDSHYPCGGNGAQVKSGAELLTTTPVLMWDN